MRALHRSIVFSMFTGIVTALGCAQQQDRSAKTADTATPDELSFAIFAEPYALGDGGTATLPSHVRLRAVPRVNELAADGRTYVDDRITVVVEDEQKHFWSFMAKLDKFSALTLLGELDAVMFARGAEATTDDASMRVTYGTLPYAPDAHEKFVLPSDVKLRVFPRLHGFGEDGIPYIDDRLTIVAEDEANEFWAVTATFDAGLAREFRASLASAIAEHDARD